MIISGLEEFASRSDVKASTLKMGVIKTTEGFMVKEGVRYLYSMCGKTNISSSAK